MSVPNKSGINESLPTKRKGSFTWIMKKVLYALGAVICMLFLIDTVCETYSLISQWNTDMVLQGIIRLVRKGVTMVGGVVLIRYTVNKCLEKNGRK